MRKQSRISESKENFEPRLEAEAQVVLCANHNPVVVRVSLYLLLLSHSIHAVVSLIWPLSVDAMSFKSLSAVRCVSIQVRAARLEPEFPKPQSSAGVEVARKCSGRA